MRVAARRRRGLCSPAGRAATSHHPEAAPAGERGSRRRPLSAPERPASPGDERGLPWGGAGSPGRTAPAGRGRPGGAGVPDDAQRPSVLQRPKRDAYRRPTKARKFSRRFSHPTGLGATCATCGALILPLPPSPRFLGLPSLPPGPSPLPSGTARPGQAWRPAAGLSAPHPGVPSRPVPTALGMDSRPPARDLTRAPSPAASSFTGCLKLREVTGSLGWGLRRWRPWANVGATCAVSQRLASQSASSEMNTPHTSTLTTFTRFSEVTGTPTLPGQHVQGALPVTTALTGVLFLRFPSFASLPRDPQNSAPRPRTVSAG